MNKQEIINAITGDDGVYRVSLADVARMAETCRALGLDPERVILDAGEYTIGLDFDVDVPLVTEPPAAGDVVVFAGTKYAVVTSEPAAGSEYRVVLASPRKYAEGSVPPLRETQEVVYWPKVALHVRTKLEQLALLTRD